MTTEKVEMDDVIASAQSAIIRTGVGFFTNSGPRGNIISVESRVAFSTVVNELYREGYEMVSPEEYAEKYGVSLESVYRKIKTEGSLLLLSYPEGGNEAVPLEEMEVREELGARLK